MNKYKVGDKIVLTVTGMTEMGGYPFYVLNDNFNLWEQSTDKYSEPLSTYTEPLEAKIRRQAVEITRLLKGNERLKAECEKMSAKIDAYELYGDQHEEEYNQAFNQGVEAAWNLARKITCQPINGGFNRSECEEIFDEGYISDVFEKYTYPEAAEKVAEWERQKEEIKAGDVFEFTSGGKAVVMKVYEDGEVALFFPDGGCGIYEPHESWHKTGRHIDIDSFLKQIGGEQK